MSASLSQSLVWGHGPLNLEIFLEPTCPFSGKAFAKLLPLLAQAGEDRLRLQIRLLSQPWHLLSPTITRAILAAATLPGGKAAAYQVMDAVFREREQFILIDHCSGPNLALSVQGVLERIAACSGVNVSAAFPTPALMGEIKWQARYARQNGIHVTPTFMVDGLVAPDMGSGDSVATWLDKLGLA